MWKWLRSWFAWRFSLRRLVVATVFLGAVVGLNMREIGPVIVEYTEAPSFLGLSADDETEVCVGDILCTYNGWPLPFDNTYSHVDLFRKIIRLHIEGRKTEADNAARADWSTHWHAARYYRFPLTHQTYRLSGLNWDRRLTPKESIIFGIIDALVATIPLALLLFLQIPRRKVAAKGG